MPVAVVTACPPDGPCAERDPEPAVAISVPDGTDLDRARIELQAIVIDDGGEDVADGRRDCVSPGLATPEQVEVSCARPRVTRTVGLS